MLSDHVEDFHRASSRQQQQHPPDHHVDQSANSVSHTSKLICKLKIMQTKSEHETWKKKNRRQYQNAVVVEAASGSTTYDEIPHAIHTAKQVIFWIANSLRSFHLPPAHPVAPSPISGHGDAKLWHTYPRHNAWVNIVQCTSTCVARHAHTDRPNFKRDFSRRIKIKRMRAPPERRAAREKIKTTSNYVNFSFSSRHLFRCARDRRAFSD